MRRQQRERIDSSFDSYSDPFRHPDPCSDPFCHLDPYSDPFCHLDPCSDPFCHPDPYSDVDADVNHDIDRDARPLSHCRREL